jgi:hypothetical protein
VYVARNDDNSASNVQAHALHYEQQSYQIQPVSSDQNDYTGKNYCGLSNHLKNKIRDHRKVS